jgi:(d)CTP diphosphatase
MNTLDVVAAIIHRRGEILLAQRPLGGDQPGLWEFPGGKVEPGESQPQALARELWEELGIRATVGDYIASQRQQVTGRIIHLHAWTVPDYQSEIQLLNHSALVWCRPGTARDYPLAPADIPLLAAFMASPAARPAD